MTDIVIDLEGAEAEAIEDLRSAAHSLSGRDLRRVWLFAIANQIEVQTRPARIPEPTLWGVVLAYATKGDTVRREWDHRHDGWWTPGYTVFPWANLVEPILLREGIN